MRHAIVVTTLASSLAFSALLSGCATKHSTTSPALSTDKQHELSVLKNALALSSEQTYTQIQESGISSVGNPADADQALPSHIKQTIEVDGSTAQVIQDSAPDIYSSENKLYYAVAGHWLAFPLVIPVTTTTNASALSNVTASNITSLFQTFNVKQVGANQLVYTLSPVDTYRPQFFGAVSKALHRVMVGQDPYNWTLSVGYVSNPAMPFENETVKLTLTQENGSWAVTNGTWDTTYTNIPNETSKIDVTESYQHKQIPVSVPENVLHGGAVNPGTDTSNHPDGQIISLTPVNAINIPDFYTSLNAYKMTYWSQNIPVVAYVAIPKQSGTYPLYVECHGGWISPVPITYINSPLVGPHALAFAQKSAITVTPNYRGYGDSQGPVSGIAANAVDTMNAIKAIESRYKVEHGHIYLQGTSTGGGVVLKVASEQPDIRSVVAISPYVGADVFVQWYLSNEQNAITHTKGLYAGITDAYGPFHPNELIYQKESIDYKKITAPTLLLQGTGDETIQWQTVQALYNDMKAAHKNVKFDLVKDANHGFTGPFASVAGDAKTLWYAKYGEGTS